MDEQLLLLPETAPRSKYRKLLLAKLPPNEDLHCAPPPPGMAQSMSRVGQLQAIGVEEKGDGSYKVLWGRKRILTARKLGWLDLKAEIYEAGLSVGELMTLIENEQRRESLSVKLDAIEALRLKLDENTLCKEVGINKAVLKQMLVLLDGLIPEMRLALAEGRMAQGTALRAARLTHEQQAQLAGLERIRQKDVDALLNENLATFFEGLPEVMFSLPDDNSWEETVRRKLREIQSVVPPDRQDIIQSIERINECLDRELAVF